jgi:ligand-binding sensor domain-containing protein/signal transduction histidine kinase
MCSGKHKKILRLLLVVSFPAVLSLAMTEVQAEQLPIKTYTTADGLADDRINRIVQDSHGLLWFCTAEGLSHFDGYKFTNYSKTNGMPNDSVNDLLETRDGTYLVGTGGGLLQFNPKGSPLFSPMDDLVLAKETINELLEDRAGIIWCGTTAGLYRLERAGHGWSSQLVDLGLPRENGDSWMIDSLMGDAEGSLWVGTRGSGLCRYYPDGRVERFTTAQGLLANKITALLQDRVGRVWVGTVWGLCRLVSEPSPERPVVARSYIVKDGLTQNWIPALFQTSDGRFLVGGRGISELIAASDTEQPQFRTYTAAQGLSHKGAGVIAEDRDGNVWLGTLVGAMKIARNGFYRFGHQDGLEGDDIHSIFEDQKGELYTLLRVETPGRQFIARFDGRRFDSARVRLPASIRHNGWGWAQVALQDRDGDWWVATGEGLCRFPAPRGSAQPAQTLPRAVYTTVDGLVRDDVFRLFEDSLGNIWVATTAGSTDLNGLTRWERSTGSLHTYTEADGLPGRHLPSAFGEDHAGGVWVGLAWYGLARYSDERFRFFTVSDGAPPGWIHAIFCDHLGRLWVSGGQGGVSRIDDPGAARPSFVSYTTAEGLSSNQVNCITEDIWGRLYFGTSRGLDRLDSSTGHIKHYTTADGLFPGRVRYALRDRSGALWFGTDSELARFNPEPDRPQPEPAILIQALRIAGAAAPISELGESQVEPLRLSAGQNRISIDFAGIEFDPGEVLRYQYKLESSDRDWSAPTDQRTVNYANLAPGSYRFLVRAVTAEGAVSSQPAVVAFTIPPPLWLRWWFLMLAAAALAMLAYAAHRFRVARLVQLERVRTRIATDLHDDIGSSLSRMALLSEVAKRKMDGSQDDSIPILTEIADSARAVVDSMSDIVWAIDPRLDDLSNVVFRVREFASDLLGGAGIQWQLAGQPEFDKVKLSPHQRRQLFLIFKEAINNAARHAGCNSVSLSLALLNNQVIGEIRDDGRGFAVTSVPEKPGEGRGGHGLENIRKRAAQLGGQLTIDSSPGRGSTIKVEFPLKRPWHEHAMAHGRKIR